MTLERLDITFGRKGYPKNVEYTESDFPNRWETQWNKKNAFATEFYVKETNKKITYSLNRQGYREQEWNFIDWNNSIVCLGCSHTFGVGVPECDTIPAQLQKKLKINFVNLGIPGGCNFFSVINSANLINRNIKPKAVIFQRTYKDRWFIMKDKILNTINSNDKEITNIFPNIEQSNFIDDNCSKILKSQWKSICPVLEFDMQIYSDHSESKYIARDGAHWNGVYFSKITKYLTEKLINTIPLEGDINELN